MSDVTRGFETEPETNANPTSQTESKKSDSTLRYERYLPIIQYVSAQTTFQLKNVKEHCHAERPGFVTRLVNELVEQGWVIKETDAADRYRWNVGRGEFSVNKWIDDKLFGTQLKSSPVGERPRERLLDVGAENLSNSELLAILIRSGRPGESALMGGAKLAKAFAGKLERLPAAGRAELKAISPAIEKTAFCQIMAGIELGRRVAALSDKPLSTKIGSSGDAIAFCDRHFDRLITDRKQEEFHIVTLDTKNHVIDTHQVTVGTLDASLVHPREVFRLAIKDAASSIILVHNHPSGDSTPSHEDLSVTTRLESVGETIGIDVLDHIVVARHGSTSIRECR